MPLAETEMPEAKSKYFSVSIPSIACDADTLAKLKHALEMTLKLHTWAKNHAKCSGFYEESTSLNVTNPNPTYIAFHEPKLKSNLRTLLPEYEITRLTEEEFATLTKDAKNCMPSIYPTIDSYESNVNIHNMKPIATKKTVSSEGIEITESLCTFSITIQKRHLNRVGGMVRQISFENPEGEEINVFVNKNMLYTTTHGNCVNFTIPQLSTSSLSRGQIVQTIASGVCDQITREKFPDFCDGDVRNQYLNMSRIDGLELDGLSDDTPISLECYTIMKSAQGSPFVPAWTTYSFSI
jgi:hypothetical protein